MACVIIWAVVSVTLIVLVESLRSYTMQHTRRHKPILNNRTAWVLVELYRHFGFFSLGALTTLLFTELAKYTVGRLRPFYLTACGVKLTPELCHDEFGYEQFVIVKDDEMCDNLINGEFTKKQLIDALKERDLYDNTILVFTADHGDMRGEHRRQNKGVPMEASGKIPFVIRWPGGIPEGLRIDDAMNTTDFMPTILSLLEGEASGKEEGRDLSALFQGEKLDGADITFMRGTTKDAADDKGWIAAVTSTHKLILSDTDEPWLLNLEKDPDELKNFADDPAEAETRRELARQLQKYAKRTGDPKIENPHTSKTLEAMMA